MNLPLQPLSKHLRRDRLPRLLLIATLILASIGSLQTARAQTPALVLRAPKAVAVGEPVSLTLEVQQIPDIAGYETIVLFDRSAAEFDSLQQRRNGMSRFGRD